MPHNVALFSSGNDNDNWETPPYMLQLVTEKMLLSTNEHLIWEPFPGTGRSTMATTGTSLGKRRQRFHRVCDWFSSPICRSDADPRSWSDFTRGNLHTSNCCCFCLPVHCKLLNGLISWKRMTDQVPCLVLAKRRQVYQSHHWEVVRKTFSVPLCVD